jgi:hypothetical protein
MPRVAFCHIEEPQDKLSAAAAAAVSMPGASAIFFISSRSSKALAPRSLQRAHTAGNSPRCEMHDMLITRECQVISGKCHNNAVKLLTTNCLFDVYNVSYEALPRLLGPVSMWQSYKPQKLLATLY